MINTVVAVYLACTVGTCIYACIRWQLCFETGPSKADTARTLYVSPPQMYRALLAILCIYTASRFVRQFAIVFQTQEPWLARLLQDIFDYLLLTSCMFVFR